VEEVFENIDRIYRKDKIIHSIFLKSRHHKHDGGQINNEIYKPVIPAIVRLKPVFTVTILFGESCKL
jgi:hypothetical protein